MIKKALLVPVKYTQTAIEGGSSREPTRFQDVERYLTQKSLIKVTIPSFEASSALVFPCSVSTPAGPKSKKGEEDVKKKGIKEREAIHIQPPFPFSLQAHLSILPAFLFKLGLKVVCRKFRLDEI